MVVSNALASSGSASSVAYVSAAPGTFPDAASAAIRNQTRNGASQSVQVIDGGFDPVGISADVGDELSMAVSVTGSGSTSIVVKVPPRHPPEVVRTNPRNGRDDVALNVHLVVVFSEPVDKSSLKSSNIALVQDETSTTGSLQVADDGLSAEFIPDTLLLPETTYALVFWRVHDLDGDPLYNRSVTFTTAVAARVGTIVVTSATTGTTSSDLDPDGYGVSIDGQPAQPIGVNGTVTIANLAAGAHTVRLSGVSENCIVAGTVTRQPVVVAGATTTVAFDATCEPIPQLEGMLAFVSERDGNPEIYVINADGTGQSRLTEFDSAAFPYSCRALHWASS